MSIYTAGAFLLLSSVALLAWYGGCAESNFHLSRWLPVSGSVTLMAMIGFGVLSEPGAVEEILDWRTHTYEVLLATDALVD